MILKLSYRKATKIWSLISDDILTMHVIIALVLGFPTLASGCTDECVQLCKCILYYFTGSSEQRSENCLFLYAVQGTNYANANFNEKVSAFQILQYKTGQSSNNRQ